MLKLIYALLIFFTLIDNTNIAILKMDECGNLIAMMENSKHKLLEKEFVLEKKISEKVWKRIDKMSSIDGFANFGKRSIGVYRAKILDNKDQLTTYFKSYKNQDRNISYNGYISNTIEYFLVEAEDCEFLSKTKVNERAELLIANNMIVNTTSSPLDFYISTMDGVIILKRNLKVNEVIELDNIIEGLYVLTFNSSNGILNKMIFVNQMDE